MVSNRVSAPCPDGCSGSRPVGDDEAPRRSASPARRHRCRPRWRPDLGGEELLEGGEQDALKSMVSASSPRRKVVIGGSSSRCRSSISFGRRRTRRFERAAFDLAPDDQHVELAAARRAHGAFQIVLGPEQALAAGLALATVMAPSVSRAGRWWRGTASRPSHPSAIGRNSGGCAWLVRCVRPGPEWRRRPSSPASREIVDAQAPVPRRKVGVIAAPIAASVREDEDALLVIHEGCGLGRGWPAAARFPDDDGAFANDAPRAARHLGNEVHRAGHLIQRARHRRQVCEPFDQPVTPAASRLSTGWPSR